MGLYRFQSLVTQATDEIVVVQGCLFQLSYTWLLCHLKTGKPGMKMNLALSLDRALNCLCLASGCLTNCLSKKWGTDFLCLWKPRSCLFHASLLDLGNLTFISGKYFFFHVLEDLNFNPSKVKLWKKQSHNNF